MNAVHKLTDFQVLTFDCYGTLIDWETGILHALKPMVQRAGRGLTSDQILETFARYELQQETNYPRMLYSELLGSVQALMGREWGVQTTENEDARFGASIAQWPAFEDSVAALQYLKEFYRLVILSNVDRASFRESNKRLGVEFDAVFTAEDIGSYKPALANFEHMLTALGESGITKERILHTAESLFHDHLPCNQLGVASAWIHRRHAQQGCGATAKPAEMPRYNFRFTSLREMAQAHKRCLLDP